MFALGECVIILRVIDAPKENAFVATKVLKNGSIFHSLFWEVEDRSNAFISKKK